MTRDEARDLFKAVHDDLRGPRTAPDAAVGSAEGGLGNAELVDLGLEGDYRDQFSTKLQSITPNAFERFCRRLLLESGFQSVEVTGRSGDGGIDAIGLLQINPLVSSKVLVQCKRYAGAVAVGAVRDFRGAMMGRSDNGIIMTTGTFTAEARKEAVREGVPPIELVDGSRMIELCEQFEVGLKPAQTFEVNAAFFAEISD